MNIVRENQFKFPRRNRDRNRQFINQGTLDVGGSFEKMIALFASQQYLFLHHPTGIVTCNRSGKRCQTFICCYAFDPRL